MRLRRGRARGAEPELAPADLDGALGDGELGYDEEIDDGPVEYDDEIEHDDAVEHDDEIEYDEDFDDDERDDEGPRSRRGARGARRSRVRGLGLVIGLIVAIVVAAIAAAVLWFTPLLSVRGVEVEGNAAVSTADIELALAIPIGTALREVDTDAASDRVFASNPRIKSVQVRRKLPSTITVTITERVAVAFIDLGNGPSLVDDTGLAYVAEVPPPGLPRLIVDDPRPDDLSTMAALGVLDALPPPLRGLISEVSATGPGSVRFALYDGRVVVWGDDSEPELKAAALNALLTQPGHEYNVSSPRFPVIRP